jgi:hypothetical protein
MTDYVDGLRSLGWIFVRQLRRLCALRQARRNNDSPVRVVCESFGGTFVWENFAQVPRGEAVGRVATSP